ncbi:ATP-dependent DNA helicase PIF1 [Tanacetum coccineum]
MALQYPLLFLYGEDGFHEKIPYHNNTGTQKIKRGFVTMKEYYSYIIQQCPNQGTTLLIGGRLFQHYLVDAYTAVEEQRLKCTRNNQDTPRVDLYHNLCDAVTRGDTSAAGLGKRIVLPRTFMGSPRYMMHNYQDAMALCRAYDNPDLFITFTSNPKWPEIAKMLAYFPGQKAHDRPKVGIRVFKLKLTELLDDLTKKHVFGQSEAGLPHAHILLWLEEHSKCRTPSETDDIISAELPSPTDDPVGYKVVTEYMLHGPCGKDARYATCTNDGKCSKHFPKPFLAKTFLDEEGYPHYRRRDNKLLLQELLLPAGRTAHSRFIIPLELMENSTCGIKQNTQLAELMQEVHLIIWDEAPNDSTLCFEALDITMRVNEYCANGEIDTSKQEFNRWVLAVGDGTLPAKIKDGEDEPTWIDIPEKFLIKT